MTLVSFIPPENMRKPPWFSDIFKAKKRLVVWNELNRNHRRNRQFQKFSLNLYVSLKDLYYCLNVDLKKNPMRNEDIFKVRFY